MIERLSNYKSYTDDVMTLKHILQLIDKVVKLSNSDGKEIEDSIGNLKQLIRQWKDMSQEFADELEELVNYIEVRLADINQSK